MTSPYLDLRWRAIIRNEELVLLAVQQQDPRTMQWNTLHWLKCHVKVPVGQPGRWVKFLDSGAPTQ